jgi:hypothetical protein
MDYFPWGHIKTLIYTSPIDSEEDRIARIFSGSSNHQVTPWHF